MRRLPLILTIPNKKGRITVFLQKFKRQEFVRDPTVPVISEKQPDEKHASVET